MDPFVTLPITAVAALVAGQIASIAITFGRLGHAPRRTCVAKLPPITVLRPVCGIENKIEATLRSTFLLDAPNYEVLFCFQSEFDRALPLVQSLVEEYPQVPARILIGDGHETGNPKLNNLMKGWAAARHDWIVMADSNLALPRDYLRQLWALWAPGTGLVSSPAVGSAPEGLAARIEAAFLNTLQGRWQLFADEMGQGYAQGKTLLWHRATLDAAGGLMALGEELAEDVAATKLVWAQRLKVRVAAHAFPQPLGRRSMAEVWRRQVRWAKVRRFGFPALYTCEILAGALPPALILTALTGTGVLPWLVLPLVLTLWYGAELALARRAGWPAGPADLAAWVLRDLALPAVWLAGWIGCGFTWHGNKMAAPRHGQPRTEATQ